MIREIDVKQVADAVSELCIKANKILPKDLADRIEQATNHETNPLAKSILCDLTRNLESAKKLDVPICQDTGMAVVFIEIGQDVHFTGGDLNKAINDGVADGYIKGLLRCSIVKDPLRRVNTNDNTPSVIHASIVSGDKVSITVAPKGFGSENMSAVKMFTPTSDTEDIIQFVLDTVQKAGSNPCPPIVVGVGIGGNFEHCTFLAKKALCESVSEPNPDKYYSDMEQELLRRINLLDVGVQGFGGNTTALAVKIKPFPTHIAGLPVAVNIGCHVTRHASVVL